MLSRWPIHFSGKHKLAEIEEHGTYIKHTPTPQMKTAPKKKEAQQKVWIHIQCCETLRGCKYAKVSNLGNLQKKSNLRSPRCFRAMDEERQPRSPREFPTPGLRLPGAPLGWGAAEWEVAVEGPQPLPGLVRLPAGPLRPLPSQTLRVGCVSAHACIQTMRETDRQRGGERCVCAQICVVCVCCVGGCECGVRCIMCV